MERTAFAVILVVACVTALLATSRIEQFEQKQRKVYFLCPCLRTGGPESIHQVCDVAQRLGYPAYVVYTDPCTNMYTDEYPTLQRKRLDNIDGGDVIVIPEVFNAVEYKSRYPKCTIVIWWLSWDHGTINKKVLPSNILHAFQSVYALRRAQAELQMKGSMLTDFTTPKILDMAQRDWTRGTRKDVVVFNATKDKVTPNVCANLKVQCVAIAGMSKDQVINTLVSSKVYADFGNHPGQDRLPREAAALGCVVITNRAGSASTFEDVPIMQKCDDEQQLGQAILAAFANYNNVRSDQRQYLAKIIRDKDTCIRNLHAFMTLVQVVRSY